MLALNQKICVFYMLMGGIPTSGACMLLWVKAMIVYAASWLGNGKSVRML